jgi:DNA-directed RNA polymerase specialized sigma24 family protein
MDRTIVRIWLSIGTGDAVRADGPRKTRAAPRPRLTKSGEFPASPGVRTIADVASEDPQTARGRAETLLDALAYDELRAIASRIAATGRWPERDPTSLLHESIANWMKRGDGRRSADRESVVASMVAVIRNAAIDRARRRSAANLPASVDPLLLDEERAHLPDAADRETLEALAAVVDELRSRAPRAAIALELRIHGGLELEDVAKATAVSLAQAKRDIAAAKAFVRHRLAADRK